MYYEPSPPTHRDVLPLYLPQAPRVKAEAKTVVLHREQRCQAALKFSNRDTRRQRSELFFERQKQMARVLKLRGFLQDREDMLSGLNEGVDRTWETNMGKGGTCYRLNCIPPQLPKKKNRCDGFLTPSVSECDLIWNRGLYINNQVKRGCCSLVSKSCPTLLRLQ